MHLDSSILIARPPERVWRFLGDIDNIPKWDRGVAAVTHGASGVTGVGFEFDTVADMGAQTDASRNGRMSYRIAEVDPDRHQCRVELTSRDGNARYFKSAWWTFRAVGAEGGTRLMCSVDFVLRVRWLVLAPVLYMMRGAITKDLRRLKAVLEAES
jgi:uncharacterized protein YndB with AHSA1/START domain